VRIFKSAEACAPALVDVPIACFEPHMTNPNRSGRCILRGRWIPHVRV